MTGARSAGTSAADLATLLAEHEVWLTAERGLAANTVAAYRRDLARYAEFLTAHGEPDPASLSEATVAAFVGELEARRDEDGRRLLAASTVARATVSVRSFHRFCAAEGLTPADPSADVRAPRVPAGLPKALEEEEVVALLGAIGDPGARGQRDRAILEVLYATGVRISELVGLDVGDVDLVDGVARVLGKGSRERVVPVGGPARRALAAYLEDGRQSLADHRSRRSPASDVGAVFLNVRGGRLTRQGCWAIVRTAGERAGLGGRLSPHVLRHSCATHMVGRGADIRVVQELLGHASLSTTQVYTKVSMSRLRRVYDAAHPRAARPGVRSRDPEPAPAG